MRDIYKDDPDTLADIDTMEEMQKVCEIRYEQFGAAGMASKIKAIKLSDMAKRYASGELDHKF